LVQPHICVGQLGFIDDCSLVLAHTITYNLCEPWNSQRYIALRSDAISCSDSWKREGKYSKKIEIAKGMECRAVALVNSRCKSGVQAIKFTLGSNSHIIFPTRQSTILPQHNRYLTSCIHLAQLTVAVALSPSSEIKYLFSNGLLQHLHALEMRRSCQPNLRSTVHIFRIETNTPFFYSP
jgi:hypothetical protein